MDVFAARMRAANKQHDMTYYRALFERLASRDSVRHARDNGHSYAASSVFGRMRCSSLDVYGVTYVHHTLRALHAAENSYLMVGDSSRLVISAYWQTRPSAACDMA